MARQIPSSDLAKDALKKHESYFYWLCQESGISGPLAQLFYETDFRWTDDVKDDENRAKEAVSLREQYALYLLTDEEKEKAISKKEWHNVDILKKSILGPACVFEVLVSLARDLNDMLNIGTESAVKTYFERLMMNAGFDFYDEEDLDSHPEVVEQYWKDLLDRILDRKYLPDGEGGLFPMDLSAENSDIDQTKRPLWNQLNDWANVEFGEMGDF